MRIVSSNAIGRALFGVTSPAFFAIGYISPSIISLGHVEFARISLNATVRSSTSPASVVRPLGPGAVLPDAFNALVTSSSVISAINGL